MRGNSSSRGQWEDMAREALVVRCSPCVSIINHTSAFHMSAFNLLQIGHKKTRLPGSATACVLVLSARDNWVSAANLGDSGFLVVRNGTVLFQTPTLQHFFDCPYQFGAFPEHVEATDYSSDAQTFRCAALPGPVSLCVFNKLCWLCGWVQAGRVWTSAGGPGTLRCRV